MMGADLSQIARTSTARIGPQLGLLLGLAVVGGCASADGQGGRIVKSIGGSSAVENIAGYSDALACQAALARGHHLNAPRVTAGRIADLTGKFDAETGAVVSQGATLFALTALGRAGFPVVERYDTTVSDLELAAAKDRTISDNPERAGLAADNYRKVLAGQIAGSDYYIVGGVTELNADIASKGEGIGIGGFARKAPKAVFIGRDYVINVAVDLRLVNTRTQEVTDMVSFQKKVVGHELRAGVFGFANGVTLEISGSKGSMEPMHLAVRTLIERAVFEFSQTLYGQDARACLKWPST
jgi:curli biogenesis system outer membrane secretion channel CsgG